MVLLLLSCRQSTSSTKVDLLRSTAAELQALIGAGELTSLELVQQCHQQILHHNERLKAIISISPLNFIEKVAKQLDLERQRGTLRSSLHGIPVIVKVCTLAKELVGTC